ncbi:glycosyltransferase [Neorhizobium sp. DT-125]|uniref:glycosyltransferase n=1 Tax=Neorhizobium sp. DT-125 TaxID=3396163 RepID=UPI003F1D6258
MLKPFKKLVRQYLLPIFPKKSSHKPLSPPRQPKLDTKQLKITRDDLERFALPANVNPVVSIVMPTYNRGELISGAIKSVLSQTYRNFQLIIVDDGSRDDTRSVVEGFNDSRIIYIWQENQGVSAARNTGLRAATGEYVAYIDSDNQWRPKYLEYSIKYAKKFDADCIYSILTIVDGKGAVKAYRAAKFDPASLWDRNFIDLNVFFHKLRPNKRIEFDNRLRRAVDWDYIVRVCNANGCKFAYFDQCIYSDAADNSRLTLSAFSLYTKVVRAKNHFYSSDELDLLRLARLAVAIVISAPSTERANWGDYYYARSLQKYLIKLGYAADLVYSDTPDPVRQKFDVNIVIRGRRREKHKNHQLNILWIISHPETVSAEECLEYDYVFAASAYLEGLLRLEGVRKISTLLQGSDPELFRGLLKEERSGVLFVGRTKNVDRRFVVDLVQGVEEARVIGDGWEKYIDHSKIQAPWVQYPELPTVYGATDIVLSEHWRSMRLFGIVANRVSDAIGCGARVLSDKVRGDEYLEGASYRSCITSGEALTVLKQWKREHVSPDAGGFVSMEAQAASIDHVIASLIFRFKGQVNDRDSQDRLVIKRGCDWKSVEWLLMNHIMPRLPARKLSQLGLFHEEVNGLTSFEVNGREATIADLPSLLLEEQDDVPFQKRGLDERLWRVFSVGRHRTCNPRIATVIANSVEEAFAEYAGLIQGFEQVRVWDSYLTRRAVIRNGKLHKEKEFIESVRARIRRYLLDAESLVTALCSSTSDREFYYHVGLASGSYVLCDGSLSADSIRDEEKWRPYFLDSSATYFNDLRLDIVSEKLRGEYWAKFADHEMK